MRVVIAGDLVPINSNEDIFKRNDLKGYFSDFQSMLDESDLFLVNLECPLTCSANKAFKSGSSIKANPETILGIKTLNINLLSLANNHLGDFGYDGVTDTLRTLGAYDLNFVGGGKNIGQARKPYIYKAKGKTVGVLSYSDFEFGIANDDNPGANPFDTINAFEDITQLKQHVDYIIVLLHDGKEYYSYPSPQLQKIGRYLVDLGSNMVVCQHSHVIGAAEKYKTGTIVYGQGNFLFDYRGNRSKEWSQGIFICIDLSNNNKVDFVPFKQNYPGIVSLTKKEKQAFDDKFNALAFKVNDNDFIKNSWGNLIEKQSATYLSNAFGHSLIIAKLLKRTGLYKYVISKKMAIVVLNFLRSRVHRESFISVLENKLKINR